MFIEKRCLPDHMQHYIGSTTRFIHDCVKEHQKSNKNSSAKKHTLKCQNKDRKGIEVKIIVLENDPVNLRLFEAFYIRKNHLHFAPVKNVPNLLTYCSEISFCTYSLTITLAHKCIDTLSFSSAFAEYFILSYPSLMMPLSGESSDF